MSTRTASPGAAILRASRMFSLPSPIPSPPGNYHATKYFDSDTGTTSFPTKQVIMSPMRTRTRGDWGFKRAMPAKAANRSGTPLIRVSKVDTIEHVTDYSPAAEHTFNLEKWQEMNMPLTMPGKDDRAKKNNMAMTSAFEESYDTTIPQTRRDTSKQELRWKFRGPWLAGMSDGEFNNYIQKKITGRRAEFMQALKAKLATRMNENARRKALEEGLAEEGAEMTAGDITEDDVTAYLRVLRVQRLELDELVCEFLDLAPASSVGAEGHYRPMSAGSQKHLAAPSPYQDQGPPVTHPSAGLSYLRTNAYVDNHPAYGPIRQHPPSKARLVLPKRLTAASQEAMVGVGGFVVAPGASDHFLGSRATPHSMQRFDTETPGGAKMWVQPTFAKVLSNGRPMLNAEKTDPYVEAVAKEMAGEAKLFGQDDEAARADQQRILAAQSAGKPRASAFAKPKMPVFGTANAYGLNVPRAT